MSFFSRGPSIPSGWVQAPGDVQAEIFLVWQEDELPDELKNSPGYVPFTLSPGAEQWVRGMAEIKEIDGPKEKLVIGRPRPAAQIQHRPLIADPAPSWPAPPPSAPTWQPSPPAWEPSVPLWEPNMAAKEWIRRQAPRAAPDIEVRGLAAPPSTPEAPKQPAPHAPPAVGTSAQIEPVDAPSASTPGRAAPEIGGERRSE